MPFNCYTDALNFNSRDHYNNCVGLLGLIPNLLAPPPDRLSGLVWDSFVSNVEVVGNGCSVAYNVIFAAGVAGNYDPGALAILAAACAGEFQPGVAAMDNQMNNSPIVLQRMAAMTQILRVVYDPYGEGFPRPGGLAFDALPELGDTASDIQVRVREFLAKGVPFASRPFQPGVS